MSTNITIVDRVVDRIKLQPIGDLIQEEDLFDIVKEAIPKAFFERPIVLEGYGDKTVSKDPVIVQVLRELLTEQVKISVQQWVHDNQEVLISYWQKVLDDNLLAYVQTLQSEQAAIHIKSALMPLLNQINTARSQAGLGYISL